MLFNLLEMHIYQVGLHEYIEKDSPCLRMEHDERDEGRNPSEVGEGVSEETSFQYISG